MRKRAIILLGLLIILSSFVSAFSSNSTSTSEWRMFGRTLDNTRYYNDTVNMTNFKQLWNYTTSGAIYGSPAIATVSPKLIDF